MLRPPGQHWDGGKWADKRLDLEIELAGLGGGLTAEGGRRASAVVPRFGIEQLSGWRGPFPELGKARGAC